VGHVVLLGDSIFDNLRYVPGGPDVVAQLRAALPRGWSATLLAVDGAVAADVPGQLGRLPADATHLVVSAGGNDALGCSGLVNDTAHSAAEGFAALAEAQAEFERDYRALLRAVLPAGKPTAVCTVYDSVPGLPPAARTGLSAFNDVIVREAARAGLPVLDLRPVCDRPADYSDLSPIEPSRVGGAKIAEAIARVVAIHDFGRAECVVYGRPS
jgi:lysophospholipase L1-like esterase